MAVDWMQKWRDAGAKGDFRVWLGSQQVAQADRLLIGELVDGGAINYDQLIGVAEHWGSASAEVKAEAVKRITEMKGRQKGTALTALKAAFTRLKGEKDAPKELVDAVLSAA